MKNIALLICSMLLSTAMIAGKGHAKIKLFFKDAANQTVIENAHVTVYQDGTKIIDEDYSGSKAAFKFKNNHRYIIEVKKAGYASYFYVLDFTKATKKDNISIDSSVFFAPTNECANVIVYDPNARDHFSGQILDIAEIKKEIKE